MDHLSWRSALKGAPFIMYVIAIFFAVPNTMAWFYRAIFLAYAIVIFVILKTSPPPHQEINTPPTRALTIKYLTWILFAIAILFFVCSRLYMFTRYGVTPLGYDTGYYLQTYNLTKAFGTSIGSIVSNNIAYTLWLPSGFLGLDGLATIQGLHLLNQFLTFGAIYFLARSIPQTRSSPLTTSAVLFLFAVSITQFMVYWWFFYKESFAILFALIAVGLFLRKSPWAIPVAVFSAALHLHPAVPFSIAFILLIVFHVARNIMKKQPLDRGLLNILFAGIGAVALLFFIKGSRDVIAHLEYVGQFKGLATYAQEWQVAQTKGLFIPFSTMRLNALFYLPFALIGILSGQTWRPGRGEERALLLPLTFIAALILSYFPFVYQNRSLIILDLLLILFAAQPLARFIHSLFHETRGKVIVILFLIGTLLFSGRLVWNHQPQIYKDEIAEIRAIKDLRKEGDYAMATSAIYTPWVYMYTDFNETIVPGWLSWDKWDLSQWRQFWIGNSDERRLELLRLYGDHTIYMFVGSRQLPLHPNLQNFLDKDPHMTNISPHLWRYSPNAPSLLPSP